MKARRLKAIAKHINENWPKYEAVIRKGYCNTDRKLSGTRLRVKGKGRHGNKLIVRRIHDQQIIFEHNSAETYRSNSEVEHWINMVESGYVPTPLNQKYVSWY